MQAHCSLTSIASCCSKQQASERVSWVSWGQNSQRNSITFKAVSKHTSPVSLIQLFSFFGVSRREQFLLLSGTNCYARWKNCEAFEVRHPPVSWRAVHTWRCQSIALGELTARSQKAPTRFPTVQMKQQKLLVPHNIRANCDLLTRCTAMLCSVNK